MCKSLVIKLIISILLVFSSNLFAFDKFIHTGYMDMPDLSYLGFTESQIIYEQQFYSAKDDRSKGIKKSKIVEVSNILKNNTSQYVIIDIEFWLTKWKGNSSYENLKLVNRYSNTIKELKKTNPNKKIGYYGIVPAWAHWDINSSKSIFNKWLRENDFRKNIVDSVDVLYPSIYTYHEDPKDWLLRAKTIIAKARKLSNGKKKVIPFIWPRYHQSSEAYRNGKRELSSEYWRLQLELVYSLADGFVIWDGAFGNRGKWDANAAWWKETEQFMKIIKI